jgi:KUP system potassium uptake protein
MGELVKMRKNATQLLDRNVVLMVPKPLKSMDDNTPALLQFFLDRVGVLPKNLLLVEVIHKKVPWIHGKRHESVVFYRDDDKGSVISVTLFFGFMEDPNVEQALENMVKHHEINLPRDPSKWVVHISYENITVTGRVPWVKRMRLGLYLMLRQAALPAYFYYGLGKDVNLSIEVMPIKIG